MSKALHCRPSSGPPLAEGKLHANRTCLEISKNRHELEDRMRGQTHCVHRQTADSYQWASVRLRKGAVFHGTVFATHLARVPSQRSHKRDDWLSNIDQVDELGATRQTSSLDRRRLFDRELPANADTPDPAQTLGAGPDLPPTRAAPTSVTTRWRQEHDCGVQAQRGNRCPTRQRHRGGREGDSQWHRALVSRTSGGGTRCLGRAWSDAGGGPLTIIP
jgi:hypothetical protein